MARSWLRWDRLHSSSPSEDVEDRAEYFQNVFICAVRLGIAAASPNTGTSIRRKVIGGSLRDPSVIKDQVTAGAVEIQCETDIGTQ
jgi:hypothetical protein